MSIRAVIRNCIIYFYYNGSYIPAYFWDPGGSVKPEKSVLLFFFLKMSESVILVGTVQTKP